MPNTRPQREKRILIRTNLAEHALFSAAGNLEPLATWARKSLVRSAKRTLKKKIIELEAKRTLRADKQIVQITGLLEAVGEKLEAMS
jgi:hypothetical protein